MHPLIHCTRIEPHGTVTCVALEKHVLGTVGDAEVAIAAGPPGGLSVMITTPILRHACSVPVPVVTVHQAVPPV